MKKIINLFLILINRYFNNKTTYYFSFSQGNDSNDGLTHRTAKKTLKELNRLQLPINGYKVLFKCNDNWLDEKRLKISLYSKKMNIFSSYGKGKKPVLPTLTFLDYTSNYKLKNLNIKSIKENHHGLEFLKDNNNIIITNCDIETNYKTRGISFCNSFNLKVSNCKFKNCLVGLVFQKSKKLVFEKNECFNNKEGTILIYENSSDCIIRNNKLDCESDHGAGCELGWNNTSNCQIYNNIIHTSSTGIFVSGNNHKIYNNLILDDINNKSKSCFHLDNGYQPDKLNSFGTHDNYIANNIYIGSGRAYFIFENFTPQYNCYNNNIYNNIFYTTEHTHNIWLSKNIDFKSFISDYNCYYRTKSPFNFRIWNSMKSNGNIPKDPNTNGFKIWQIEPYNQDKNSFILDPQIENKKDGSLSINSSCINKGKDLSNIFKIDFNNKPRLGKWDLGIYRYDTA